MRAHTRRRGEDNVETVQEWQERFAPGLGRRVVWASDEYYLLAGHGVARGRPTTRAFPSTRTASGWCARFEQSFAAGACGTQYDSAAVAGRTGFFAWVEGAPAEGYRAPRTSAVSLSPGQRVRDRRRR